MAFDFRDLAAPIVVAPMAGGPSTPELAAAGTDAGGLGFVPAGYLTAPAFAQRLEAARGLTSGPIGANLFVPKPSGAAAADVDAYAARLAGEARRYGTELGEPRYFDEDWSAKLDVLLEIRPAVVSFTFGLPSVAERRRLSDAGITTVATVTTLAEARQAADCGVDVLAAQGPSAGGHRGTFDAAAEPAGQPLEELVSALTSQVGLPVVAAGGLMTAGDVARVRAAGAVAAQLGTAFLCSDEAGSTPVHRAALQGGRFTETVVTKAFSGRYARGLRNRFIDEYETHAPLAYPELHYLTGPLRAAAARAGDPDAVNIWAGTGFAQIRTGPVHAIMALLH
ncbi:2-nitropropane dioxygenase [Mycolicibacterium duvalii]|uniref:Propionate 3-nitronate monooxygenase n=1 Tax=Mycolicibacterium duvalii TaxID=39688 RepID=A0A7I7JUJ1_9MYCO|nr:nitronate monooxygenase [Mycolicibacterium duvalii]MCV7369259.1 nitronate monooxygenase [Mycolicibacterium duvalii]PEG37681.1 2-nitropropane dioxygenase [Mycolicibacterium duvalii]BBX15443.1 oxidoreductase [Mycolicibacterium duvalii]